jgi:hypothetical protein
VLVPRTPDRTGSIAHLPGPGCDDHGNVTHARGPVNGNPIGSRVEQLAQALAERIVPLIVDAIDIDALLDRVDVEKMIERVDVEKIIERVDVEKIIDRVDVEKIIDRVDVEKIIERVDVEKIIDRVDVEKIIERVDVQGIIERVDINAVVDEIDIDALVEQTELGSIIARSTTGVLTEILDVIRAQGVGLDDFVLRWGNRLVGRGKRIRTWPAGPPLLVAPAGKAAS